MEFREQVPLAAYTTFGIGGPARWFAEAATEADVVAAVTFASDRSLPLFVLGGGSNLLVLDQGFPGLVLRIVSRGIDEAGATPGVRNLSVAAGENWDALVSFAVAQGCGGIECLAGIPGTVGGTPIQNVGAYGQEVSTTITSVRVLELPAMQFLDLPATACGFAYRQSIFNTSDRGRYIVTRVDFQLPTPAPPYLGYRDLALRFAETDPPPSLAEVAAAVRDIRKAKGMLLVAGDPDCSSAGSFFKNPVLPVPQLPAIAGPLGMTPAEIPQFAAGPGLVKVPAAWLLERAGFHRGYQLGRSGISSRHTLALINRGGATAEEILALRDRITAEVWRRFGVRLEAEPVIPRVPPPVFRPPQS